ncbi:MAG: 8-oxo-dGTP diphosphatase [Lachnospiraceae bacterium]|nr:8-oxo-dGTP diphosphatase [Lachnospiraceae bacterium]
MKETTLCYIEQNDQYLMLYRNKKPNDPNAGKWIGVGGKLEPGETPDECVVREVKEETGLFITPIRRGVIYFHSDRWEDETMYLYTAEDIRGTLLDVCNEGELRFVPKEEVLNLNLWEGDRVFLRELLAGNKHIEFSLSYEGDTLKKVEYPILHPEKAPKYGMRRA